MKRTNFSYKDLYIFFLIIYILCLPLGAINIGPLGSALKLVSVFPICIALFYGAKLRFSTPLLAQLAFTLLAFFSIYWSVSIDVSIDRVISYVLLFALIVSGAAFRYTALEIKKIKYALVWSSRLTAVTMLLFSEFVQGRFTFTEILEEDPNYICAYLAFGVVYALGVLTEKGGMLRKGMAFAELALYLFLVLITGSRGGLLAIMAAAVVYLMTFGERASKHIVRKFVLLSVVLVAMLVMIEYLPDDLRLRFTVDNVIESGGTGRIELWEQTIDLFVNSDFARQLFGYGTATIRWCFERFHYAEVNVAHNIFMETLAELGIVGLFVYSAAIFSFVKAAFFEKDKFAFAVVFGMFVMSLSTSIYTFKPYFNIMLFIVILQNKALPVEGNAELLCTAKTHGENL